MFLRILISLYLIIVFLSYACAEDKNFYMSAENIVKDDKNNIIRAKGNVEIRKGNIYVTANSLKYNLKKKEIIVKGNVRMLSDTGNVIFAEKAMLNEELKESLINNLGLLLSDGSRLASQNAISTPNNEKTVYRNTVFTKCSSCNDGKNVLWQIKAKKATHIKKSQIMVYEGVILEAFNIPVIYVPFFYHPDPTVKSKTGLLTPKFSSSNVFGYTYEQPFYLKVRDDADITFKPKVTSKEGLIFAKDYRKKFDSGELRFRSSITHGSKVRENEPTKKEIRGHIDFGYADVLANDWLLGANIKKSSDKSYLARYKMSDGESVLTQNIFLEKGNISNSILLEVYKFQTLSDDFSSSDLPFIRPQIKYIWNNFSDKDRNRMNQTKVSLRSITNRKEEESNSIHLDTSSQKARVYNGLLIKDSLKLNFDFYNTKNTYLPNDNVIRALPELGLELKYPLINYKHNNTIIEPIIQMFLSSENDKNSDIKNNDSKTLELMSVNLFEENRYSGYDRLEDGFRVNYGFTFISKTFNESSFYSSFGRTFHLNEQEYFNYTNGFGKHNSDFVGNLEYIYNDVDLYYDFRISDDFELNKNRVKTSFNLGKTHLDLQYSQIRNFASSKNPNTEQINFSTSTPLFKDWKLYLSQYRDLAGAQFSSPLRTSLGIEFKNTCTLFRVNFTKDKSNDIDVPASANLAFVIELF